MLSCQLPLKKWIEWTSLYKKTESLRRKNSDAKYTFQNWEAQIQIPLLQQAVYNAEKPIFKRIKLELRSMWFQNMIRNILN